MINNYGLEEPFEGDNHRYTVVPVVLPDNDTMSEAFEEELRVDRDGLYLFKLQYTAIVHVDLPLAYSDHEALSDLTARIYLRPVDEQHMIFVLNDIHVM